MSSCRRAGDRFALLLLTVASASLMSCTPLPVEHASVDIKRDQYIGCVFDKFEALLLSNATAPEAAMVDQAFSSCTGDWYQYKESMYFNEGFYGRSIREQNFRAIDAEIRWHLRAAYRRFHES